MTIRASINPIPPYGGLGHTCRDIEGHIWTFGSYDPWA